MKMITDKQKAYIYRYKNYVDGALDKININELTRKEASDVLSGLFGIADEYKRLRKGVRLSVCLEAHLDKVFDVIESHKH